MKRVRALDKETGAFVKNNHASVMSEGTRHTHDYACMDPACGARFHWVKGHPRKENTEHVPPTFARNPSTQHKAGCNYDYEYKTKHNAALTFLDKDTGLFHLRINFPLGASWADRNHTSGVLSAEQRRVAKNRTHYKGLPNLESVVKFIEKEFGSLEAPALENLVLHYQGQDFRWNDVFVGAEAYKQSFAAAANSQGYDSKKKHLTIMKPIRELPKNKHGKRRFACEAQYAHTGKKREHLAPVIVSDTSYASESLEKTMRDGGVLLVAAAPFIPPSVLEAGRRRSIPCYYNVTTYAQISDVNPKYWRFYPSRNNDDLFTWGNQKNNDGPA